MSGKSRKFYVHKIQWRDAAGSSGWRWIPDVKSRHYDVTSIGYLIHEDKEYYTIAMSLTCEYQAGDRLQIPKKWVTKITKIKGHAVEFNNECIQ